ncbi:MAG: beta-hydroxyacyl-ACP dehydratase [Bacteroidales bacterium]|nr:beta-hydroxyacyl-ACP dehydratase [Bacteroidales bacterium]
MLFEGNLYTIINMEGTGEILNVSVMIMHDHPVFDGHFPGNPILPGVCTLQIAGELLSKYLAQKLMLLKSDNIKFMSLVIPTENTLLNYEFSFSYKVENILSVKCSVTCNEVEVLKMKGSYLCQRS